MSDGTSSEELKDTPVEEIIAKLNTAAGEAIKWENKVIQLEEVIESRYKEHCERYELYYTEKQKLIEEKNKLNLELSLFKRTSYVLFAFAIFVTMFIIFK